MHLVSNNYADLKSYNLTGSADVSLIHVCVYEDDITSELTSLIEYIQNTSWINSISNKIDSASMTSRATRTIDYLKNEIFSGELTELTKDTGEYLVSYSAGQVLRDHHDHINLPLSELWNKKKSGNPGFDFHTEHPEKILIFGEAKYSGQKNVSPYRNALEQICRFITEEKDMNDLSDLKIILGTSDSLVRFVDHGVKGYAAAFSINATNADKIFENILQSKYIEPLLNYSKLYLIGIEICHK